MAKKETLRAYLNRNIKEKGSTLKKEQKRGEKYTSIREAQKAGALYYMKNGKLMAAVLADDLKVRPVAKPKVIPKTEYAPANAGPKREPKITTTILPSDKSSTKDKKTGEQRKLKDIIPGKVVPANGSGNSLGVYMTPAQFKAATAETRKIYNLPHSYFSGLSNEEMNNLIKKQKETGVLRRKFYPSGNPKKNKGGPVTKKPKGAYMGGGMAAANKKKKPAAKKMMGGGMAKKSSGYMHGGMTKKKK